MPSELERLNKEIQTLIDKLEGEMSKYRDVTKQLSEEQRKYSVLAAELVQEQGKVSRLQSELAATKNDPMAKAAAVSATRFIYVVDPDTSATKVQVPILINSAVSMGFPWGDRKFWKERNDFLGPRIPDGASVLDLGGGFCHLAEYVTGRYVSLDREVWTSATIKADFNAGEFPDLGVFDLAVCQGSIEYVDDPLSFLKSIRKYTKKLLLTYQTGDTPHRRNNVSFEHLVGYLANAGWNCVDSVVVDSETQRMFVCEKMVTGIPAYWWGEGRSCNWGDIFTEFLLRERYGVVLELTSPETAQVFGCGSVLEHIPNGFDGFVLGAGAQYEKTRRDLSKVRAPIIFRGRLSKERCVTDSLHNHEITLGDPGLLAYLFTVYPLVVNHGVGLIPHYADKDNSAVQEFRERGGFVIDIQAGIREVLSAVASCQAIVSTSLHGLVIADSLGVPNCWLKLSDNVGGEDFKFRDYYSAYGQNPEPAKTIQDAINTCGTRDTSAVKSALIAAFDQFRKVI